MDFLEAVFEEAQRKLFSDAYARLKTGDFYVQGELVRFERNGRDTVCIKVQGFKGDVFRPE